MLQDDESLALALRGGLRGRFQGTFNQLENAVEVLDDYMLQHLNPAEYADLRTMMREINWQLAYLRRLGDHAADAAAAPRIADAACARPPGTAEPAARDGRAV